MHSKYYDVESFRKATMWTDHEISLYLGLLESASPEQLRELLNRAGIKMFDVSENIDEEQAINALINGHDISKSELFRIIDHYLTT